MMANNILLTVDGLVEKPLALSAADLAAIDVQYQVPDVGTIVPGRRGRGVLLRGLLALARPKSDGDYLTLHSTADDFHASVPLSSVRDVGVLVYEIDGQPLPKSAGGPLRFLLPDSAACHTAEIDECANVKFVDRLEVTAGRGHDNRPSTVDEHARLHQK
ncbi:MAG: molybdopterin-dependent oxidoreductase [Planctomycetia bacterium]|nr:molybdopterin-dependent oxidoreductase [Planctomycetia bacterium]